jgi:hypothetical protein
MLLSRVLTSTCKNSLRLSSKSLRSLSTLPYKKLPYDSVEIEASLLNLESVEFGNCMIIINIININININTNTNTITINRNSIMDNNKNIKR